MNTNITKKTIENEIQQIVDTKFTAITAYTEAVNDVIEKWNALVVQITPESLKTKLGIDNLVNLISEITNSIESNDFKDKQRAAGNTVQGQDFITAAHWFKLNASNFTGISTNLQKKIDDKIKSLAANHQKEMAAYEAQVKAIEVLQGNLNGLIKAIKGDTASIGKLPVGDKPVEPVSNLKDLKAENIFKKKINEKGPQGPRTDIQTINESKFNPPNSAPQPQ